MLFLSLPMGKAWARYMPNVSIFGISLNPGPFTIKEHIVAMVMVAIADETPYGVGVDQI
jgi:OPT oligopeptide transporter protein